MVPVTTRDRVKKVVANLFGDSPDSIQEDVLISKQYQIDSLDTLDLMFQLEDEFGLESLEKAFPNKAPQTVREIISVIQQKLDQKNGKS